MSITALDVGLVVGFVCGVFVPILAVRAVVLKAVGRGLRW